MTLKQILLRIPLLVVSPLMLLGCAGKLHEGVTAPTDSDAGATTEESVDPSDDHAVDRGEASIDAQASEHWAYFSLESGDTVTAREAWHLAFQRYKIRLNTKLISGEQVEVARLDGVRFEEVSEIPESGFHTDEDEGGAEPRYALSYGDDTWYAYDPNDHSVTARPFVYVVRTGAQRHFKVQFLSYYDDAGTPAVIRLRWEAL